MPEAVEGQSCMADFLVEAEKAPQLAASRRGEVFFIYSEKDGGGDAQVDKQGNTCAQEVRGWLLGVSARVVAPQSARVFLLSLQLYPLGKEDAPQAGDTGTFQVVPLGGFLPTVLHRQLEALSMVCSGEKSITPLVERLVFGRVTTEYKAASSAEVSTSSFARLNERQLEAVLHASSAAPLTLVQGPPGTGKSEVAVSIVEAWLEQDSKTPILVATGTHAAKDLLDRRLRERGIVPSERRRLVLKKSQRDSASPVFVETVYMAAMPRTRLLPRVLLDESSQMTEAAALVALARGCEKLVLIGDPKQLGPVSNLGHAGLVRSAEYAPFASEVTSFFQALSERHNLQPLRLSVQYRMDPRLCEYPSQRFYDGDLKNAASTVESSAGSEFTLPAGFAQKGGVPGHPALFIDTAGLQSNFEELVPFCGALSYQNRLEARLVVELFEGLQATGVEGRDVSVLTAYGAQRDLLAEALHGTSATGHSRLRKQRSMLMLLHGVDPLEEEPHPRAHTVDGFQGNESDFVIFSAVRSNELCQTGFVGDKQRLCVLLTRARRGLLVVGNSDTLRHDEEWAEWLETAPKQTARPTSEFEQRFLRSCLPSG
eukprot:TRINITY_DN23593_c0_g1_i1.p1 TRINITY_DN23593_c0_g1~~TRINITY_DN23593_c0_g1_i1.p1  ORF type:complete len:598 (+),score=118.20 TRINITY_DN23593_c0_g1_i1:139-1932(+)